MICAKETRGMDAIKKRKPRNIYLNGRKFFMTQPSLTYCMQETIFCAWDTVIQMKGHSLRTLDGEGEDAWVFLSNFY